jgi:5,6-dimethylbenzimidazole synthase
MAVVEDESVAPDFGPQFRSELMSLFTWRRDVRRFETRPLAAGTLERLIDTAALAPSVGLSEPWRFVIVETDPLRSAVRACFERCNSDALADYSGSRASVYARMKLAGLGQAPVQFAVFADMAPSQGHGLGRRTMPETAAYSVVMAIHTLWLAARAEGIGLGWISIIDPDEIARLLDVPPDWKLIGYFCLGYPIEESRTPELQGVGWENRHPTWVLRK